MKHFLDGKLIAIGIFDLCESYLISTQFIYDPDYSQLSMGWLGALKEIEYMKKV